MAKKKGSGEEEDNREYEDIAMDQAGFDPDTKARSVWGRVNMSSFELKVWKFLGKEDNHWGFLRQWPVEGYFLDFFTMHFNVAIEADGPSHIKTVENDRKRDQVLFTKKGIRTIRITPADFQKYSPGDLYEHLVNRIEGSKDDEP